MPNFYPVPNPSKSYWIQEGPNHLKGHRTTKLLPSEVDLIIIGSGYSGTSVAANLMLESNAYRGKKILMLEARDVCSGATGRNGGHIRSFYHNRQKHYLDVYGEKLAAEQAIFEHNELNKVSKLIEKYNIDCNFDPRVSCNTVDDPKTYQSTLNDFYSFQNNQFIPQNLKDQVKIYFGAEATKISDHNGGPFCITAPTCSVWPYKLVVSLLTECIKAGLNLQTFTLVEEITQLPSGKWEVFTGRGKIITSKIVCATNAYTKALLPEFRCKILPVKGVVSHIKTTNPQEGKLKYNYFHTYPVESDYVTAHKDNSIIAGGGGNIYLCYPVSLKMFNTVDDSYVPLKTIEYFKDFAKRNYVDFSKDKDFVNDYTWCGCMAYTDDEFPFVGSLGKFGRKGVYLLAGYTGHGMPRIWSCGEYIAGQIDGTNRGFIPDTFKITLDRMFNETVGYLNDIIGADIRNRGKFKL